MKSLKSLFVIVLFIGSMSALGEVSNQNVTPLERDCANVPMPANLSVTSVTVTSGVGSVVTLTKTSSAGTWVQTVDTSVANTAVVSCNSKQ